MSFLFLLLCVNLQYYVYIYIYSQVEYLFCFHAGITRGIVPAIAIYLLIIEAPVSTVRSPSCTVWHYLAGPVSCLPNCFFFVWWFSFIEFSILILDLGGQFFRSFLWLFIDKKLPECECTSQNHCPARFDCPRVYFGQPPEFQHYWNCFACRLKANKEMGCLVSTPKDTGGYRRRPTNIGDVSVFVPGLRIPKPANFSESLGDHLSKSLVERLSALRTRIVVMAGQEAPTITRTRRKTATQHG